MSTTGLPKGWYKLYLPTLHLLHNERTIYQQLSDFLGRFDQEGWQFAPTLFQNSNQLQPVTKCHDLTTYPYAPERSHPPHQHEPATEAFGGEPMRTISPLLSAPFLVKTGDDQWQTIPVYRGVSPALQRSSPLLPVG